MASGEGDGVIGVVTARCLCGEEDPAGGLAGGALRGGGRGGGRIGRGVAPPETAGGFGSSISGVISILLLGGAGGGRPGVDLGDTSAAIVLLSSGSFRFFFDDL